MRIHKIVATFVFIYTSLSIVVAQMDCPSLVQTVVETVASICENIEGNQLCYGHPALTVTPRENAADFTFEQSGDLVSLADIQTLQLGAFNLSDETWGAAVMNLQLNPSVPDSAVTFVVFGDVEIENMGDAAFITARVNAPNPINIRSDPTTQGAVISVIDSGTSVILNGRNATGDWVRVLLDEGATGWVAASLLQSDTDFSTLNVADDATEAYAPMQSFTLSTGNVTADCAEVPASGVLLQTSTDTEAIPLQVNAVDIELSGTAFLQATAGNRMFIHVLHGSARVTAQDSSVIVPAGAVGFVDISADLLATDVPARPSPYTLEVLQVLPLQLLPQPVELIEPLAQRQINTQNNCWVVALTEGATFREGPGTAYFGIGTLIPDNPYLVYGRADGRDGYQWWYVTGGRWIRADIVTASGNCDNVEVVDERPADPSTTGFSTNTTCTFERIVYAEVGTTIPIVSEYVSSAVPVGAIVATITVDGTVIYEGQGTQHGTGLQWTTSWVATEGIHNVEALYTPTIQITPDWANNPFEPGESWSFAVCQIRVE
jgi:uncharacterized protein YraI